MKKYLIISLLCVSYLAFANFEEPDIATLADVMITPGKMIRDDRFSRNIQERYLVSRSMMHQFQREEILMPRTISGDIIRDRKWEKLQDKIERQERKMMKYREKIEEVEANY